MDDLPWDLIFYGATAVSFIGIIAASRAARKKQRTPIAAQDSGGTSPPKSGDKDDRSGRA